MNCPPEGAIIEHGEGHTYISDYQPPDMPSGHRGYDVGDSHLAALLTWEGGGSNCIEPLVVGADLDVPVMDADLMGRAFPELHVRKQSQTLANI